MSVFFAVEVDRLAFQALFKSKISANVVWGGVCTNSGEDDAEGTEVFLELKNEEGLFSVLDRAWPRLGFGCEYLIGILVIGFGVI